jgi:hypothetical protein
MIKKDVWRPTSPGKCQSMLSLNSILPFRAKPKNKTVRTWPKVDNIIPLGAGCYICYIWYQNKIKYGIRAGAQPEMGGACTSS